MKKIVFALLVMMISLFSIASAATSLTFKDLPKDHWAYNYVYSMVNEGVINGYEDGSFNPSGTITRAEFAKILTESFKIDTKKAKSNTKFEDVSKDDWYYPYVNAVSDYLSDRTEDGKTYFDPSAPATRAEMTMAMVLAMGKGDNKYDDTVIENFIDNEEIPEKYKKYVAIAYQNGYISGYDDNTFRAEDPLTRAESTTLVTKTLVEEDKMEVVDWTVVDFDKEVEIIEPPAIKSSEINYISAMSSTSYSNDGIPTQQAATAAAATSVFNSKVQVSRKGNIKIKLAFPLKSNESIEVKYNEYYPTILKKATVNGAEITIDDNEIMDYHRVAMSQFPAAKVSTNDPDRKIEVYFNNGEETVLLGNIKVTIVEIENPVAAIYVSSLDLSYTDSQGRMMMGVSNAPMGSAYYTNKGVSISKNGSVNIKLSRNIKTDEEKVVFALEGTNYSFEDFTIDGNTIKIKDNDLINFFKETNPTEKKLVLMVTNPNDERTIGFLTFIVIEPTVEEKGNFIYGISYDYITEEGKRLGLGHASNPEYAPAVFRSSAKVSREGNINLSLYTPLTDGQEIEATYNEYYSKPLKNCSINGASINIDDNEIMEYHRVANEYYPVARNGNVDPDRKIEIVLKENGVSKTIAIVTVEIIEPADPVKMIIVTGLETSQVNPDGSIMMGVATAPMGTPYFNSSVQTSNNGKIKVKLSRALESNEKLYLMVDGEEISSKNAADTKSKEFTISGNQMVEVAQKKEDSTFQLVLTVKKSGDERTIAFITVTAINNTPATVQILPIVVNSMKYNYTDEYESQSNTEKVPVATSEVFMANAKVSKNGKLTLNFSRDLAKGEKVAVVVDSNLDYVEVNNKQLVVNGNKIIELLGTKKFESEGKKTPATEEQVKEGTLLFRVENGTDEQTFAQIKVEVINPVELKILSKTGSNAEGYTIKLSRSLRNGEEIKAYYAYYPMTAYKEIPGVIVNGDIITIPASGIQEVWFVKDPRGNYPAVVAHHTAKVTLEKDGETIDIGSFAVGGEMDRHYGGGTKGTIAQ